MSETNQRKPNSKPFRPRLWPAPSEKKTRELLESSEKKLEKPEQPEQKEVPPSSGDASERVAREMVAATEELKRAVLEEHARRLRKIAAKHRMSILY